MVLQVFATIEKLVAANNQPANLSNELIIAIIWKESGFDDAAKSKISTATGFMQMTIPAVDDVNRNTPKGTHFAFSDMLDGGKNIQCGTFYLDIIYRRSSNDVTKALNSYGTGTGYATNLIAAEACLQAAKGKAATIDPEKAKTCLFKIHR
jgi:soluble lytic murein transglycosylase-like protein